MHSRCLFAPVIASIRAICLFCKRVLKMTSTPSKVGRVIEFDGRTA